MWGWAAFWRAPEPETLRLTVLALGTSTAGLIEAPDGARLLIDTGPPGLAVARALDARLPPFDRRLDGLMLTGGGEERLGGLTDLANRYRIGSAWAPIEAQAATEWLEARPLLSAAGTQLSADVGPGRIALADGADLAFAAAGPRLACRQCRVLWITAEPDARWLESAHALIVTTNLDLLVLADALVAVNPRVVVLLSRPVSPPPELEAALAERTVLALDLRGDVTLIVDGERLWVETERDAPKT